MKNELWKTNTCLNKQKVDETLPPKKEDEWKKKESNEDDTTTSQNVI